MAGGSPGRGVLLGRGYPWQGGLPGRGSPWQWGLFGRGVSLAGGSPWQGGLPARGVSLAEGGLPGRGDGGCFPAYTEAYPPVNRMTDACENITLPQTSFAGGNKGNVYCDGCAYFSEILPNSMLNSMLIACG